jgi:hypothetical protein
MLRNDATGAIAKARLWIFKLTHYPKIDGVIKTHREDVKSFPLPREPKWAIYTRDTSD